MPWGSVSLLVAASARHYLAVWELGELQGKGARRAVEVLARVVRIQAYAIMGASTQGWWPFVNNEHR